MVKYDGKLIKKIKWRRGEQFLLRKTKKGPKEGKLFKTLTVTLSQTLKLTLTLTLDLNLNLT
jgi:hypothetical protein